MRSLLAAALLLSPALCRGAALPPVFENSGTNSSGVVCLKALTSYITLTDIQKTEAVEEAATALKVSCPISIQSEKAGELWTIKEGKAEKLDAWSDQPLPLGPKTNTIGRWFAAFGMQSMGGGDFPSSTINLRLGSTLFQNRYDLAFTYDYSKPRDAQLGRAAVGLVGRALMPLSQHAGWNIGGQLSRVNNAGIAEGSIGLVTGLNIYLPRGSFDITLNLQDKGVYGFLVGYTVFISR